MSISYLIDHGAFAIPEAMSYDAPTATSYQAKAPSKLASNDAHASAHTFASSGSSASAPIAAPYGFP